MMIRPSMAVLFMAMSPALVAGAPTPQRVEAARVIAAARSQIDAKLGSDRDVAHVSVVGTPEDISVPAGTVSLTVRTLTGRWPRARVGVPVDIALDGRIVRSATVWFALDVHRQALGFAADSPSGTLASSLKLVDRDTDVAAIQGDLVTDPHALENMRLRHAVLADAVVTLQDFERVPDVDPKQRVQVMVAYGAIQMQAKGTAIGKGNAGDMVAVLVDDAEAPVRARVTDKGVVQVVQ